jgi:hypothetical protein
LPKEYKEAGWSRIPTEYGISFYFEGEVWKRECVKETKQKIDIEVKKYEWLSPIFAQRK